MSTKKDERGSPKLPLAVYREIGQFAVATGNTIGAVLVDAWQEYKKHHAISIPPIHFEPEPLTKKRQVG